MQFSQEEVNSLPAQDECESLETLFANVDLGFAEKAFRKCFHTDGPGRPPRKPLGLFRAFIVMRMKGIRSLRELSRLLNIDLRLRRICLLDKKEKGYPRSVLSRFTRRVGSEKLNEVIGEKVVNLLKRNKVEEVDAVLDASFIKAWSIRNPMDNRKGFSDEEARVGRTGRAFDLGYKLHLSIDSECMLPLASIVASANQNEKKHSPTVLEKTKRVLSRVGAKLRSVITDSQYSAEKVRKTVETVIPYPANQKRGVKGILRVDKKFRSHGPEELKRKYHKRPAVEAVFSFLKTQYSLAMNKVRGLKNVTVYALYSILSLVLTREAAENIGRTDKAVSPTYFNT
jgi:transposase